MSLPAGARLGPYEVLAPLGAGGMGEVYRARDTRLGRAVAVKILTERLVDSEAARQRFEREARAVAALSHPNIVALHDVGREGAQVFAVTELLEGETLQERLLRGALPVRKVIEIGAAIADGLSAAHAKGIVHRDLKPSNVFVTSDGRVKVLDFGLAKQQDPLAGASTSQSPTQSQTEPGTLLGTVGYMSPEQVRGAAADARSDIFALGCVLYEMASGERAFARETAAETLAAILREEPRGLAQSGTLPVELRAVIAHCLEKQPGERFQSARDLAFALRSASSGELARGDDSARPRPRLVGPRAVVAAGGLLALLLVVVVMNRGGLSLRGGPATIRSIAVLPLQNLSGDSEQEYFADGLTEALITDLAKARSLKVISRTSVMQYKNVKKPLPEIARALGVEAVIEGSVLRSGGRVRVTAQLIDASTDRHLWAEEYERDLRDVLSLQREIARAIVREVHVALTPQEEARLSAARRRVVPESHEAYLRGRLHVSRLKEESITTAIRLFEKAIAADPLSAEAHAGLAIAHHELGIWGSVSPRATAAAARAAVSRALELDDSLAEAHCALGMISEVYDWDWVTAEREMKRAIELGGGEAGCHQQYAVLLQVLRRFPEAIAESEHARRLDPLSAPVASSAARVYYRARQHDKALAAYQESIDLDPAYLPNYARLADVYLDLGRNEEALAALERGRAIGGATRRQSEGFATVFAALGRRKEATEIRARFEEMASQGSDQVAWRIALIETALGHKDDAIAWLERAFRERSASLFLVNAELRFDPLRSDPRFQALLRRMKFPE